MAGVVDPSPKVIKFLSNMHDLRSVVTDEYGTFQVSMIEVGSACDDVDRCQPSLDLCERMCSMCSEECLFLWFLLSVPFQLKTYKTLLFHATNFVFSVVAFVCVFTLYVSKLPLSLVACSTKFRRTELWTLRHLLQLDCMLFNFVSPQGEHVMVYSPSVPIQHTEGLYGMYAQLYFGGVKLLATGIPGALAALLFMWSLHNVVAMVMHVNSINGHPLSARYEFDMMLFVAVVAIYACILLLYLFAFISQRLTIFFCSQYLLCSRVLYG